ncbi:MAG: hypothetical protein CML81_02790 [Rhodobiaceae bacterium]|nr:hypothetical protein [Rhodobiaceae bacterium]RPF97316.1 MAG: hypothetical protein CBD87_002770 [Rhizobiales bacterium TMED227]|tara:strand:- start:12061 stop:12717 length:657 start_codon:yes stop_codon:yes gene_type:complete
MAYKQSSNQINKVKSHSRNVKIINYIIYSSLLIISILILTQYIKKTDTSNISNILDLQNADTEDYINISEKTIEIENSIISGVDEYNQFYEIKSEKVINSSANAEILELTGISTKLLLRNEYEMNIIGDTAIYDNKRKYLKLNTNIEISSNQTPIMYIKNLDINLSKKIISSAGPVLVKYNDICIRGKEFVISENGNKIKFTKGVNLKLKDKVSCQLS